MNDRFSAQLRQHLLETANERPADGALAAIDARVAVTGQRLPLAARLTLDPGRIGRFPTATLRFVLVAVALGLAIAGAALFASGARDRSTVFEGTWTTIDPADDSTQVLFVSSGITPEVRYVDDFATGGACVDDPAKIFTAEGTATVDGNVLHVAFPDGGGCGLQAVEVGPGTYTHDEATDTIVDDLGFRWERVERAAPSNDATAPPIPAPTADASDAECVNLADGGTYTAPVGPLSATATVPDGTEVGWQGSPGTFYLRISCSNGEVPISIHPSTATEINQATCVPQHAGEIADFADAVARLSAPQVDDISGPIDLTIDGHPAVRFDVTDLSGCAGFGLWHGTTLGEGESGSVYVIDVDGELVAIEVNRNTDATQAQFDEAGAIVASLRFDAPGTQPPTSAPPASGSPATPPPVAAVAPSSSPEPTASPEPVTFSSGVHGISIDHPAGWQTRLATEPWTGGPLTFDSPAADVIFDPAHGPGLHVLVASQPYGDRTKDAWRGDQLAWLCDPGGAAFGSATVDGADAFAITCGSTASAVLVFTDTRGYLIRLVASPDEPGFADTYDWDWHRVMLETVDLRPDEALEAPSPSAAP